MAARSAPLFYVWQLSPPAATRENAVGYSAGWLCRRSACESRCRRAWPDAGRTLWAQYKVADIAQADFGRMEIELAEVESAPPSRAALPARGWDYSRCGGGAACSGSSP